MTTVFIGLPDPHKVAATMIEQAFLKNPLSDRKTYIIEFINNWQSKFF